MNGRVRNVEGIMRNGKFIPWGVTVEIVERTPEEREADRKRAEEQFYKFTSGHASGG